MKNTISEMKKTLRVIIIRLDEAEDKISELEDKVEKNSLTEQQNEIPQKRMEKG